MTTAMPSFHPGGPSISGAQLGGHNREEHVFCCPGGGESHRWMTCRKAGLPSSNTVPEPHHESSPHEARPNQRRFSTHEPGPRPKIDENPQKTSLRRASCEGAQAFSRAFSIPKKKKIP